MPQAPEAALPQILKSQRRSREGSKDSALDQSRANSGEDEV